MAADQSSRTPPLPPVFRFAPSPNGELHLGHAYPAGVLSYPTLPARAVSRRASPARHGPRDPDGAPLHPGDDRDLAETEAAARIAAGGGFALRVGMGRHRARGG